MIELKNVTKEYKVGRGKKVVALNNISLNLPSKGMIFVIGKSGSGKSTLLNLLGFLDKPTSGDLIVNSKNVKKFKNKEIDFYRNTGIGFVFQDFNLIENFNVYKNIELALDLQKKKCPQSKLDEILQVVGLDGLGKRKISELSGGQKQRVAIGRAIIKNPSVILADEPTGNLDEENSTQIFNILKNLSLNHLVVVVSHNLELARVYADRIIEIEEGNITNDQVINQVNDEEKGEVKLVKSHLSLLKSLEFSFYNLNSKKIRLFIMIIISTVALSVFGFFASLIKFNINETHANTMIEQNETRITINKKVKGQNYTTISPFLSFTKSEVQDVTSKINSDVIKVSKAVEDNYYLSFNFASEQPDSNIDKEFYAYYDFSLDSTLFLLYNDKELNNLKLIGNIPKDKNEIVINKILADYILKYGLTVSRLDKKDNTVLENYYPKSYEEIVSSKEHITFGSSYLVICGIIDEDMAKYEPLKTTLSKEMDINPTKLYEEFIAKNAGKLSEVIVKDDFFETVGLKPNNQLDLDLFKPVYTYNDNKIYTLIPTMLDEEVEIFDGSKYQKINSLEKNQIVISMVDLEQIGGSEFTQGFWDLIKNEKEIYDEKVKQREEQIKEIEEKLIEDPNFVYEYPDEIEEPDTDKLYREYMLKYIKDNQIIGKKINLEINDMSNRVQDEKNKVFNDLEIVGIDLKGINLYFSKDLLKDYMRDNNEIASIYFDLDNKDELVKIFEEFPQENASFISQTVFSKTINNVEKVIAKTSTIAKYFSIFFLIFTVVLFMYFIISSINTSKKTIGILRALGARLFDVSKIYYLESFIIGMVSFILSSIITYFACIVGNNIISKNLFLSIKPIIFRIDLIYLMFIIVIILVTVSFILPVFKIAKTKPIKIINKN